MELIVCQMPFFCTIIWENKSPDKLCVIIWSFFRDPSKLPNYALLRQGQPCQSPQPRLPPPSEVTPPDLIALSFCCSQVITGQTNQVCFSISCWVVSFFSCLFKKSFTFAAVSLKTRRKWTIDGQIERSRHFRMTMPKGHMIFKYLYLSQTRAHISQIPSRRQTSEAPQPSWCITFFMRNCDPSICRISFPDMGSSSPRARRVGPLIRIKMVHKQIGEFGDNRSDAFGLLQL